MQVTYEELEQAFIDGSIDLNQFIEVLVDNLGYKATKKIIKHNTRRALKDERRQKSTVRDNRTT